MRFNVFLKFKTDSGQYAQWPVMYDNREKCVSVGTISDEPTNFSEKKVGVAIAQIQKKFGPQLERIEVREAMEFMEQSSGGYGSSPGYSEASGCWW